MKRLLIIFGEKSTALEMEELVQSAFSEEFDEVKRVFYDKDFWENAGLGAYVEDLEWEIFFLTGVNDFSVRKAALQAADLCGFEAWTLIHPSAVIAPSAQIGPGCYIAANSSISSGAQLGAHVQVNLNASVGHGVHIGENSLILPGARISGEVQIGKEVLVGSNAFIYQGLSIGDESRIDALTYVHQDVPAGMVCSTTKMEMHKRVL